jgi:HK97 family phage major capsid protein
LLYKKKADFFYQAQDIVKTCEKEGRQMTADEKVNYEKAFNEIEGLQTTIDKVVELANIEKGLGEPVYNDKGKKTGENVGEASEKRASAFEKWIRYGDSTLNEDERKILSPKIDADYRRPSVDLNINMRGTNSTIVTPTYAQDIEISKIFGQTKKAFGGWMDPTTQIYSTTGNTMYMPYHHDVANTGTIEAVGTDMVATTEDLVINRGQLDAYFYSSGGFKVGWDSLNDADFDINTWLLAPIIERGMRGLTTAATTGDGSSAPNGIVTSSRRMELTTIAATAPTATDLMNLLKAVNYAYHQNVKSSGWMMHSGTMFGLLATVQSSTYNNSPLWAPSFAAGAPSTLLGYPYWLNNSMDAIAKGKTCVLFGDFSYQVNRWVGTPRIIRLEERYAELLSTAFIWVQRFDCDCKVAKATATTSHPIGNISSVAT